MAQGIFDGQNAEGPLLPTDGASPSLRSTKIGSLSMGQLLSDSRSEGNIYVLMDEGVAGLGLLEN